MTNTVLPAAVFLTLTAACALAGPSIADGAKRPNIVILFADDLGYSDVGCFGGEIETPNLDRLAAGGVRLTQFYNAGRCCPARASLLAGLYPHQAGVGLMVYRNYGPGYLGHLNERCVTFAEVLGAAGYQTMMVGKWHAGHVPASRPEVRGFDHFAGIYLHIDSYWKVLKNCDVYRDANAWELYDLTDDRSETNNVIAQHPEIARKLHAQWRVWAENANVLPFPEQREEPRRNLPPDSRRGAKPSWQP